ncbi:MAG: FG-GAP repeat protein [Kofleriaceae bacterium]
MSRAVLGAIATAMLGGCATSYDPDSAHQASIAAFDPDRDRTCPSGCAEGTVCDTVTSSCVDEPGAPQLVFPIAGAITTGLPELAWTNATGASRSAIEICADVWCDNSLAIVDGVDGATLASALPRGTYFVRAWGLADHAGHVVPGAVVSSTRAFRSTGRAVAAKSALAWFADFDGNGIGDAAAPLQQVGSTWSSSLVDQGAISTGGPSAPSIVTVPDMNGDGRAERAFLRYINNDPDRRELVFARVASASETGGTHATIVEKAFPVAVDVELLPLGDFDRDGYADLGVTRRLEDGVRLQIFRGGSGATYATRRRTVDVRMPPEPGKTSKFSSISAVGDLDGDGYPDLAIGGLAHTQTYAGADRFYVVSGNSVPAFSQVIASYVDEGDAALGMMPLGDVDGDGFGDVAASDTRIMRIFDGNTSVGIRRGRVYVTFGGPSLRKVDFASPTFWREHPAPSWAYNNRLINEYSSQHTLRGIATVANGREREEYFYPIVIRPAGDVDGDGLFDAAFAFFGAVGMPDDASFDAVSPLDPRRPNSWGTGFDGFVDVRHGSAAGIAQDAVQYVMGPQRTVQPLFPARLEARSNGVFVSDAPGGGIAPFQAVFAGPPGMMAPLE